MGPHRFGTIKYERARIVNKNASALVLFFQLELTHSVNRLAKPLFSVEQSVALPF